MYGCKEEGQNIISPTYDEIAIELETQISNLDGEYGMLNKSVLDQGEEWHREINIIIEKMKAEIEDIRLKHKSILEAHLVEIKKVQNLIKQTQLNMSRIEESNEVSKTLEYMSKNVELSKPPAKVMVLLPTYNPKPIDIKQLYKLIGSLTPLATATNENGYRLKKSSSKELLQEPELICRIDTRYEKLRSVICQSDEEIWTIGRYTSDIKCFNSHGLIMKTIKTKSGKWPTDIAVNKDEDLVFSDATVYKVKNGEIEGVIKVEGWVPINLAITSSNDLLVAMYSDYETQSKIVRFSGSTEIQTIQTDEEGKPLYSGNGKIKYISENRNLDICVADWEAGAVVVVNHDGIFRFNYTGHLLPAKDKSFKPFGIGTDSQSQILTADSDNHCIHILDQDGQFLGYVDNCRLKNPYGLYVDKNDYLFNMDPRTSAQDVIRCNLCEKDIIAKLDGEYEKLVKAVLNQGEEWHREINIIIKKMKTEVEGLKLKHKSILKAHLDEIKSIQNLIEQTQLNLSKIEESNEVSKTMEYISKNKELSKLPPKVQVSLPMFSSNTIDTEQLYKLIGSLSPLSSTKDENGYRLKKAGTLSKELMKVPELISMINTGYEKLRNVTCYSGEEIWTNARDNSNMKYFNIQGSIIKTIKTISNEWPNDITINKNGDLVYCDWKTKTVNEVKNGQSNELIRLQGWTPLNLCVTPSGDILVVMFNDDETESKVVRYSGSTEKQTIQFENENKPLYSGKNTIKYITENRNLDICVSDSKVCAVVVVSDTGNLRFRYTGHPSSSKNKPFNPYGIGTDSLSQILTADFDNQCIHILDQDGQFLSYIDNCDLKNPYGLCIYKNDDLLVAEYYTGNVKKIKYLK
ncbi:uncharacterized protein LOC134244369 [Saccostrea cucullata]|uniref:uncharacterized protein LOC134244369 n=1 Tax=Saccostrea cuccullata TaxID=36930 RepID=UPI002ED5CDE3